MRKKRVYTKDIDPDIKFDNVAISRFVNYIMRDGKKSTAQRIAYAAFDAAAKKLKKEPIEIFEKAIENASPVYEVVSKRVGGANYQVPREVRAERRFFLACNWIIDGARAAKGRAMSEKLADELIAAYNNDGNAIKKKQQVHKMAEANRAFAHFAR
ncbi:30S ribosomal protein S7 [Candidatus Wolfebacteria bacterium RIFCSPHIGHO2_01_FULL_48_22]|uniref:Small ribosomal subunit protein uS7 n=2 Tax=Candidatus Wolfeibacteriota TaxID=1752735 RepID=A0A1F8DRG2_9BACT|nr:MAG: 30S ribosomal protein S7 [Candidatus Wolfebacteria bacterium RIFCSPHIGHO2_01_FULL_48_22]OGM92278.1 MAG: 30S ribosomal protein S7 [Candidatus Wolfebacteria bacterium RIFCSPLOWO2_01_FULL_47_17b]